MLQEDKRTFDLVTSWGKPLTIIYREGRSDLSTFLSCLINDEYHTEVLDIRENDLVIDLGAHIGASALAFASRGAGVIAIEPIPENAQLIRENFEINKMSDQLLLFEAAIGKEEGTTTLYYTALTGDDPTGFIHEYIGTTVPHKQMNSICDDGREISVKTLPLAYLFKEGKVDFCKLLKTDCEGAEWEAFSSCPEIFLDKIEYISGELHSVLPRKEVSHGDLLRLLPQDFFEDVSEEFDPLYTKPGVQTHFTYKRKLLFSRWSKKEFHLV